MLGLKCIDQYSVVFFDSDIPGIARIQVVVLQNTHTGPAT